MDGKIKVEEAEKIEGIPFLVSEENGMAVFRGVDGDYSKLELKGPTVDGVRKGIRKMLQDRFAVTAEQLYINGTNEPGITFTGFDGRANFDKPVADHPEWRTEAPDPRTVLRQNLPGPLPNQLPPIGKPPEKNN